MNNGDRSAQAVPAVGSRLDRLVRRLPRPVQHVYWAVRHGEWEVGWGYWPGAGPERWGLFRMYYDGIHFNNLRLGPLWIECDY